MYKWQIHTHTFLLYYVQNDPTLSCSHSADSQKLMICLKCGNSLSCFRLTFRFVIVVVSSERICRYPNAAADTIRNNTIPTLRQVARAWPFEDPKIFAYYV